MKVTQRPIKPRAARQQRQVTAPPNPPNNPPSPAAPALSGGGAGVLKTNDQCRINYAREREKNAD